MPNGPKRICNKHRLIYGDEGCSKCAVTKNKERPRKKTAERGYDHRWQEASERYRTEHPLCVPCLLNNRTTGAQCVDHIIPRHSCEELFWEYDNWCSMCSRCHGRKTRTEPKHVWSPRLDRIVICGLPGTGKTTYAKTLGVPFWDADEYAGLTTVEDIQAARGAWLRGRCGAIAVIVASPVTAAGIAQQVGGTVKHMATQYVARSTWRGSQDVSDREMYSDVHI